MIIEPSPALKDTTPPETDAGKSKESQHPIDLEELDGAEDDLVFPPETGLGKKVDVRRKIEMYWEKKRLQEQIGDAGEIDFDF